MDPQGNTTATTVTEEEQEIALGLGLSIGLYVLVCVLVPLVAYLIFMWVKKDPFGFLFGDQAKAEKNRRRSSKKPAQTTVSVELGNRGADHPPMYPTKGQLTLNRGTPAEGTPAGPTTTLAEVSDSFIYTPPTNGAPVADPSASSNNHADTTTITTSSPPPTASNGTKSQSSPIKSSSPEHGVASFRV